MGVEQRGPGIGWALRRQGELIGWVLLELGRVIRLVQAAVVACQVGVLASLASRGGSRLEIWLGTARRDAVRLYGGADHASQHDQHPKNRKQFSRIHTY